MIKVFIMQYGNNDLWYYTQESVNNLLNKIESFKNINIYGIHLFKNVDTENIWLNFKYNEKEEPSKSYKCINGIVEEIDMATYYSNLTNKLKWVDLEKFYKSNIIDSEISVFILSGHGGLFESLLDMSQEENFSINTQYLCSKLSRNHIDVLLLDMCSMNYIEIIYELLENSNIANIILFNGIAPLEGIDINKVIMKIVDSHSVDSVVKNILSLKEYSIMNIKKESINKINNLILKLNKLSYKYYVMGSYEKLTLDIFKKDIEDIITKGSGYIGDTTPLSILLYELKDEKEKALYRKFKLSRKYILSEIICREVKKADNNKFLILKENSLKHIIHLYNVNVSSEYIDELYDKYIKNKKNCEKK